MKKTLNKQLLFDERVSGTRNMKDETVSGEWMNLKPDTLTTKPETDRALTGVDTVFPSWPASGG